MINFTYKARDSAGQIVRGRLEAATQREAVSRLRSSGLLVLELSEERSARLRLPITGSRRVRAAELITFYRQLATMVEAGLPLVTGLEVLARQTRSLSLAAAVQSIVNELKSGYSLAGAMARSGVFPQLVIHMVGAAEVGGILDNVLQQVAVQSEREDAIRQKVQSALVYPLLVMFLAFCLVLFLIAFVVPRFGKYFTELGQELPTATKLLLRLSQLTVHYGWLLLIVTLVSYWCFRKWARQPVGARVLDRLRMRLPVFGPLLHKRSLGGFARMLGGLLGSGIPLVQALAVAGKVLNSPLISDAVLATLAKVRRGENLAPALGEHPVFPPMLLEMTAVGEHCGTLEPMLLKVADFYEADVQRSAERLSGALEPFLIAVLGVVVGSVVIAMMAPVFQLWTMIR